MQAKRVLVTGAGGFIGRCSVPALLAAGYEVHAVLTRTEGRDLDPAWRGVALHAADLLDPDSIRATMAAVAPSHLLHFAWIATPGVYWTSPDNFRWLTAGRQLLDAFCAHGGSRAVMAGSCAEYDWSKAGVCDERQTALATDHGATTTPYAECKIAMQRVLHEVGSRRGISTAWGRIFFQYGPAEHPDRLVASVIVNLLSGREAPASHGRQIRSFLHVDDVAAAFVALLDGAVEGPVNIGSGEAITLGELLQLIAQTVGRPDLLRLGKRHAPPGEPAILLPDIGRLLREVGWQPSISLREGIADTIEWWRHHLPGAAAATV